MMVGRRRMDSDGPHPGRGRCRAPSVFLLGSAAAAGHCAPPLGGAEALGRWARGLCPWLVVVAVGAVVACHSNRGRGTHISL